MKYLPLLIFLCACSEQETSNVEVLKGNLKFLRQQRDSLTKVTTVQKEKMFEQEINLAPEILIRDTTYLLAEKELSRLKSELANVDREIERTEAEIYKPRWEYKKLLLSFILQREHKSNFIFIGPIIE